MPSVDEQPRPTSSEQVNFLFFCQPDDDLLLCRFDIASHEHCHSGQECDHLGRMLVYVKEVGNPPQIPFVAAMGITKSVNCIPILQGSICR
ncbi:hypothetical protein HRbin17_00739 [bacterium HR17]|uniref:Uncharacterized protein n=1 Tax=Candidatus Fervidibacter japonicus TaxID=2035412 RepID=A0A2H5XAM6_9BACT|nr:hypothetical protein HRbin17_00739 [bacterium HR17]